MVSLVLLSSFTEGINVSMKNDSSDHLLSATHEKRSVWDQFQHDHELIARLKITPDELDTLTHCALLGTLACKEDLLFILRQIREAVSPVTPEEVVTIRPVSSYEKTLEEPVPDLRRVRSQIVTSASSIPSHPASLAGIVQRRVPEQFGVAFWALVLVGGLMWNFAIAIAHWREHFLSSVALPTVHQSLHGTPWYAKIDDFNFLLGWEILFVGLTAAVMYLRSRRRPRRFKVRPI
jgi:hypothetical protein